VKGWILKVFSRPPIATELAVDLQLWAFVLHMVLDGFEGLYFTLAAEALNFKALAFIFNMLFKVLEIDLLGNLVLSALMHDLDLAEHRFEQLVFDWLVNWLDEFDLLIAWSWGVTGLVTHVLLAVAPSTLVRRQRHHHFLGGLAVEALEVGRSGSILIQLLQLADETDNFVAVITLFWLQRNLPAHHAGGL